MKTILAADIGYGNTKAVWNRLQKPGMPDLWNEICFRSVAPAVVVDTTGSGISDLDRVIVKVNGSAYYVGPKATLEGGSRNLDPDYINTDEHEALLCGAWSYMFKQMGVLPQSVDMLVLGLPVSGFQTNRQRLKELGGKVHKVPVPPGMRSALGKDTVDVIAKRVIVLPQPFGGLYLSSEEDANLELFDEGVVSLVIDIGYNTFDWFVASGMDAQFERCGSFQGGKSQILLDVSNKIGFDHGVGSINFGQVERALETGEMNLGHKRFSMQPYQSVVDATALGIVGEFLQRFNPSKAQVARIFVCGGAASHYVKALKHRLSDYKIDVMPESVMSNARGYYNYGVNALAN